jgi:hypothetical protein
VNSLKTWFGQVYAIDGWLTRRLELLDRELNEEDA